MNQSESRNQPGMDGDLTEVGVDHYMRTGEYPAGWSGVIFREEIGKLALKALRSETRDTLLLATEKGLTPLGRLIDACNDLLKDTPYTRGMKNGDPYKGPGNRMADAMAELFPEGNCSPHRQGGQS
mgnify:CR=1 FL=1